MKHAAQNFFPQSEAIFLLKINDHFSIIQNRANAQVECLSAFIERNPDWNKLKYEQHNNFHMALNSSRTISDMIKQHHSAQHGMTQDTKKLEDLCDSIPISKKS